MQGDIENEGFKILNPEHYLTGLWGIEREALRIGEDGKLSGFAHPTELTEPEFARDFAEAQLEIITPPMSSPRDAFEALRSQTKKAYAVLEARTDGGSELLWPFSMPVPVGNEGMVELAYKDKPDAFLYRKGLAARYGAKAQLVSGIHYNFSFSPALFSSLGVAPEKVYFHVLRNLYRSAWLLIFFFGASPRRFEKTARNKKMERLCNLSLHSLRTGPSGYSALNSALPSIRYENRQSYRQGIEKALTTTAPHFSRLKDGVDQMNGNYAQKESEVYLPFRYRESSEGPYMEIRLFDVDPFIPWGLDERGIRLIHLFIIKALHDKSPLFKDAEWKSLEKRNAAISLCGRGRKIENASVTAVFDDFDHIINGFQSGESTLYRDAVSFYRNRVENGILLSERIEREIRQRNGDALIFGLEQARKNKEEALYGRTYEAV